MNENNLIFVAICNMTANQRKALARIIKYPMEKFGSDSVEYPNCADWESSDAAIAVINFVDKIINDRSEVEKQIENLIDKVISSTSLANDTLDINNKYINSSPTYKLFLRAAVADVDILSVMSTYERKYLSNNIKEYLKNQDVNKWIMVDSFMESDNCTDYIEAFIKCNRFSESYIYKTIDLMYNSNTSMIFHSNDEYKSVKEKIKEQSDDRTVRDYMISISQVYGDIYDKILADTSEYSADYMEETSVETDNEFAGFDDFGDFFDSVVSDDEYKRKLEDYKLSELDMKIMHLYTVLMLYYKTEDSRGKEPITDNPYNSILELSGGYSVLSLPRIKTLNKIFGTKIPKAFSNVDFSDIWEFTNERAESLAKSIAELYPTAVLNSEDYKVWLLNYNTSFVGFYSRLKLLMMFLDMKKYDKDVIYNNLEAEIVDTNDEWLLGLTNAINANLFMQDNVAYNINSKMIATLVKAGLLEKSLSTISKEFLCNTIGVDVSSANDSVLTYAILANIIGGNIGSNKNGEIIKEVFIAYIKYILTYEYGLNTLQGLYSIRTDSMDNIFYDRIDADDLEKIIIEHKDKLWEHYDTNNKIVKILNGLAGEELTNEELEKYKDVLLRLMPLVVVSSSELGCFNGIDTLCIETIDCASDTDGNLGELIEKHKKSFSEYHNEITQLFKRKLMNDIINSTNGNVEDFLGKLTIPSGSHKNEETSTNVVRLVMELFLKNKNIDTEKILENFEKIYDIYLHDYELLNTTLVKSELELETISVINKLAATIRDKSENTIQNPITSDEYVDESTEDSQKTIMISYLNSEFETVRKFIGPFFANEEEAYESFKAMLDECRCTRRKYTEGYYEILESAHIWDDLHNKDIEIPENIKKTVERLKFRFEKNEDNKDMTIRAWTEE